MVQLSLLPALKVAIFLYSESRVERTSLVALRPFLLAYHRILRIPFKVVNYWSISAVQLSGAIMGNSFR